MSIVDRLQNKTISGPVEIYLKSLNPIFSIRDTFAGCYRITSFKAPYISGELVANCFENFDKLEKVEFGSITSIGTSCFKGCSSLTEVSFPSVTSLGASCFYNCSSLSKASFPMISGIVGRSTNSGGAPFAFCNIDCLDLGEGVTEIRYLTRHGRDSDTTGSIENLIIRSIMPPTLYNYNCMYSVSNIYVPDEAVEDYKTAPNWSNTDVVLKIKPLSEYVEA